MSVILYGFPLDLTGQSGKFNLPAKEARSVEAQQRHFDTFVVPSPAGHCSYGGEAPAREPIQLAPRWIFDPAGDGLGPDDQLLID